MTFNRLLGIFTLGFLFQVPVYAQSGADPSTGNAAIEAGQADVRTVHDGTTLFYRISDSNPSRLTVMGGRISRMNYKAGEIEVVKDEKSGQAFLQPIDKSRSVSLFVTLDNGVTFTLVVQPTPGPSTTMRVRSADSGPERLGAVENAPLQSMSYEQAITTMVFAAATDRLPSGVQSISSENAFRLWEGVEFIHHRTLKAAGMELLQFKLTNISVSDVRMVEQELYRPGVVAVAIEDHLLRPGVTTNVFIVRLPEDVR